MWYVFTYNSQAYNPTQEPDFSKNYGRWNEFESLSDAEDFVATYNAA